MSVSFPRRAVGRCLFFEFACSEGFMWFDVFLFMFVRVLACEVKAVILRFLGGVVGCEGKRVFLTRFVLGSCEGTGARRVC